MDRCLQPIRILLLQQLCSVSVCFYTHTPPLPSQISPPSGPSWDVQPTPAVLHSPQTDCSLQIEPSALVVRFGDPVTVNCSYSHVALLGWEGLPGNRTAAPALFVLWTEDRMTHWSLQPMCFAVSDQVGQCLLTLPVTVYKPPENVSVSFEGHWGPLSEGQSYSLQCEVEDVAPAEHLTVAFYRDSTELQVQKSTSTEIEPVSGSFTLNYTVTREDHGAQFWCEARLELGPEGPQPPPVVRSQHITVTIFVDGQVAALPTHISRKHAGKPTVSAQSHPGQEQHMAEEKNKNGAGQLLGPRALVLLTLLTVAYT